MFQRHRQSIKLMETTLDSLVSLPQRPQSELPGERLDRQSAVAVARSWVGTPYVLGARIRGLGCDCATIIAEYLIQCGIAKREDLGVYSHDWFCHAADERYMLRLLHHAKKTLETVARPGVKASPGSIALFRVAGSHVFNHGAIVAQWPKVIHAVHPAVEETDATSHWLTSYQQVAIFDPWSNDAR